MLVKTPGLTAVAVFALAVGIPVGLLPGHLVNAFEAPLPFFEGERIHLLWNFNRESSRGEAPSLYDFSQWRDQLRSFEAIAVSTAGASYNVESEDGRAAPVPGAEVTAETFEILRVAPLLGRTFLRGDEQLGSPSVVVIGYDLWQARLGGVSDVVGRTIRIGGMPHTVIGVMPDGFLFPLRDNLWLPLRMSPHTDEHLLGRAHLVFGRLADGVSPEEAQVEFETVGGRMAQGFPEIHARLEPEVVPFGIGFSGPRKEGLKGDSDYLFIQVLALFVLIVACANVGMLVFARTATRASELTVRTALGASRIRVVSQLFTEAMVFAILAATVGILLADQIAIHFLGSLGPALGFSYWADLRVTGRSALWALSLSVLSAGIAGVVPALKLTGKSVQRNLQRVAAARSGARFGGISSALIIADSHGCRGVWLRPRVFRSASGDSGRDGCRGRGIPLC